MFLKPRGKLYTTALVVMNVWAALLDWGIAKIFMSHHYLFVFLYDLQNEVYHTIGVHLKF